MLSVDFNIMGCNPGKNYHAFTSFSLNLSLTLIERPLVEGADFLLTAGGILGWMTPSHALRVTPASLPREFIWWPIHCQECQGLKWSQMHAGLVPCSSPLLQEWSFQIDFVSILFSVNILISLGFPLSGEYV